MQFNSPKIVKNITFKGEAKHALISGVDKLADAVGSTLGASGKTVVLEDDFGNPHVTKDGVTVANYIVLQDPVENLGVMMAKQASRNTASKAGDGTTTSTVLAQAIIRSYFALKGEEFSFRDIRSGIDKLTQHAVKEIEKRSVKVDEKRLKSVSTISANNDSELGELIAKAFEAAGENGIVTMENSPDSTTFIDVVDGTHISGTCKAPHFYTNKEKETAELDKPLIFLSASEIPNIRKIQEILEYAIKSNRSILLIAPLESQPLAALAMNKAKGNIKVNVIDPPSFGQKQLDILDDLALLTGAKVIDERLGDSLDLISPDVLGSAAKAITDTEGTTLAFDEVTEEVSERVAYLKDLLDDEDHHVLTKHIEDRLAILSGGVSIINVGADTEVELKEKSDRVDDAIQAVKAAKKEGILPGGGAALSHIASNWKLQLTQGEFRGAEILSRAMYSPMEKIMSNAGLKMEDPTGYKFGQGIDVIDGELKDMRKAGIIDPAMVTKTALLNAVSVATTILSTDAVVSNVRDES